MLSLVVIIIRLPSPNQSRDPTNPKHLVGKGDPHHQDLSMEKPKCQLAHMIGSVKEAE